MIKDAFYVEDKVAVYYKSPMPKFIKVGEIEVIFQCEHGVSLALVYENEVNPLLGFRGGCCGKNQPMIFLASENLYKHWLDGNGGR